MAAGALEASSAAAKSAATWPAVKADLEAKLARAMDDAGAESQITAGLLWELGIAAKGHRVFDEAVG